MSVLLQVLVLTRLHPTIPNHGPFMHFGVLVKQSSDWTLVPDYSKGNVVFSDCQVCVAELRWAWTAMAGHAHRRVTCM